MVTTVIYSPVQLAGLLRVPEPTPEQAAVIAAPLGPLAVVAGAGSGKSKTMAARLVWLVANGMVRPDRVLGLTFTRKAAAEFAGRVRSRLERLRRAGLGDTKPASTEDPEDPLPRAASYSLPLAIVGTSDEVVGRRFLAIDLNCPPVGTCLKSKRPEVNRENRIKVYGLIPVQWLLHFDLTRNFQPL